MKTLGNIIWFILSGLWYFIFYTLLGAICCITIIFIPVGLQLFKLGRLLAWPFGRTVQYGGGVGKTIINAIWAVLFGWENALGLILIGCIWCITIVGIPVGLIQFKAARFVIWPIGSKIIKK